jgi:transcriptional regulator with XRE-family HTH domain
MPRRVTSQMMASRLARGRRILRAAAYAELSLAEMARKSGIDPANLSRMIAGTRDLEARVPAIAKAAGVSATWIATGAAQGPDEVAPKRRRGRQLDLDRMTHALSAAEVAGLSRATSAWRLSPEVGQRVVESVIGASGLPARIRKGDVVVVAIVSNRS